MMTPLAPSAHGAAVGADLVFLDVARDTYVCLAGAADAGRLSGDRSQIDLTDPSLALVLQEAGLTGETPVARTLAPRATRALGWAAEPVAIGDILGGMTLTWARASARRYRRPFAELIGWAQARPAPLDPAAEPSAAALAVVAGFRQRWPWAVGRGQCLHRAFLLLTLLRAAGCDAAWVFGVRTYPFEAHCWLQIGVTVLDDPLARLAAYEPLMTA